MVSAGSVQFRATVPRPVIFAVRLCGGPDGQSGPPVHGANPHAAVGVEHVPILGSNSEHPQEVSHVAARTVRRFARTNTIPNNNLAGGLHRRCVWPIFEIVTTGGSLSSVEQLPSCTSRRPQPARRRACRALAVLSSRRRGIPTVS